VKELKGKQNFVKKREEKTTKTLALFTPINFNSSLDSGVSHPARRPQGKKKERRRRELEGCWNKKGHSS
jgi:hypothetical protein